jgi:hypothetical protein
VEYLSNQVGCMLLFIVDPETATIILRKDSTSIDKLNSLKKQKFKILKIVLLKLPAAQPLKSRKLRNSQTSPSQTLSNIVSLFTSANSAPALFCHLSNNLLMQSQTDEQGSTSQDSIELDIVN